MKKTLSVLVALVALTLGVRAESTLTIADAVVYQDGRTTLAVSLSNPDYEVVAVQFDIDVPEGFNYVEDSFKKSERGASGYITHIAWTGGGIFRVLVNSAPSTPFSGTDGVIFTFDIESTTTAAGTYKPTISNIVVTEKGSIAHTDVAESQFDLAVNDYILLDENATSTPDDMANANALVRRSIKANTWSTIVLPFSMTEEQVKSTFGSDVQLADFTGYEYDDTNDKLTVNFNTTYSSIEANHPCLIKVSNAVTEFRVDGVDIAFEDEPTVATVERKKKQYSELIGTYTPITLDDEGYLFISNNKFYYSNGSTQMKGYRAYFDFYDELEDKTGGNAANSISMKFSEGDATGIGSVEAGKRSAEGTYNVGGQRVNKAKKGIYIVDGKKVAVE